MKLRDVTLGELLQVLEHARGHRVFQEFIQRFWDTSLKDFLKAADMEMEVAVDEII